MIRFVEKSPVEILAENRSGCETVRLGNILGQGKGGGKVVTGKGYIFRKSEKRSYAVKISPLPVSFKVFGSLNPTPYSKFQNAIASVTTIPFARVAAFNGIQPEKFEDLAPENKIRWIIPDFYEGCVDPPTRFPRFDRKGAVEVLPGDIVCTQAISEALVATFVSNELAPESRTSRFFVETFNIAVCPAISTSDLPVPEGAAPKKRTTAAAETFQFMEIIQGNFLQYLNSELFPRTTQDREEVLKRFYTQVLDALEVYQSQKIVHGDLHLENIFYVQNPDGSVSFKIGDWGLACKYSEPKILNLTVMKSGYAQKEAIPWVPNWYDASYDLFLLTWLLWGQFPEMKLFQNIMNFAVSKPTFHLNGEISFPEPSHEILSGKIRDSGLINLYTGRPDVLMLSKLEHFTVSTVKMILDR